MGRNNFKTSETINSSIVSFIKNSQNRTFVFDVKIKINKNSDVIFKNSTTIEECFKVNRILSLKEINFVDTNSLTVVSSYFEKTGKVLSFDNSNFSSSKEITVKIEIKLISLDKFNNIADIDLSNNSTENNIVFMKVGAKKFKNTSGYLSKGFKKVLNRKDFKKGVLPSSRITTGKVLRSNIEKPFIDNNTISFGENKNNVNSTIGLPITNIISNKDFNEYYIDLKNSHNSGIETSNDLFETSLSLSNSNLINSPNDLGNINNVPRLTKKISSEELNNVLSQKRFEEEVVENEPFNDSIYEEQYNNTESFYSETIDSENKKNYNVLNQKKIKITLDFSEDIDLQLLNTKFAFNRSDPSSTKTDFLPNNSKDEIVNTNFFNFKNNTAYSVSSHFMPTAYWDNHNKRWTYLEGIKPTSDNFNAILGHRNNYSNGILFNKDYTSSIGLDALLVDLKKEHTDIISDINFKSDMFGQYENSILIMTRNHRNIRSTIHYSKSLLTTPGFRNDGSFIKSNKGDSFNKLPICQITDSYGFPYKANWQPHQNHMIKMSDYIGKNFLLEKVIIKGKYSSKGEMPVKRGNFYSGYLKTNNTSDVDSLTTFNTKLYSMKDDHSGYISNSLTFFILNERKKGINYIDDKIKIEPLQHYNFFHTFETQDYVDNYNDISYNTNGKSLKDYLGAYVSNDSLRVASHIVPSRNLYEMDDYNHLKSSKSAYFDSTYNGTNYNFKIGSFDKSNFFYLSNDLNTQTSNGGDPEFVYIKDHSVWTNDNFSHNTIKESNKTHAIRQSYSEDLDQSRTRDLVSYSNMVITSKTSNIELDENIYKNIDTHIIKNEVSDNLNINTSESNPEEFSILGFCKNQINSKYSDESEYKLKSNYYEINSDGVIERFYNSSYNLEGKSLGSANQLGIISDRVINQEIIDYEIKSLKSKSGKTLRSNDDSSSIVKSNYLLKPEDNLIFGVSSNCNGQVMPTAFRLHDKIEITLIGKDYIDDVQYRNNESDSIRKTVIGDDYIEKAGTTVYQTKGNYYDNVFSLDQSSADKDLFYARDIIDKKSSRKFGTYTGVLTTAEEYEYKANSSASGNYEVSGIRKYIRDTVNFSLGNVYDNIYSPNGFLELIDIEDVKREFNKKEIDNISFPVFAEYVLATNFSTTLKSSRKIILTEKSDFDASITPDLANNLFANNIISNWHKKYHLEEYKNNLKDENLIIDDNTLDYIPSSDIESLIYYDTNSYLIDTNLLEKKITKDVNENYIKSKLFEADQPENEVQETVESRYQSIKSFCLPNSSLKRYQNGIQIQNLENFSNSIEGNNSASGFTAKSYKSFLNSDKVIEEITSIHSKVPINQASLQYFNSNMNVLEYCEKTEASEIVSTITDPYYSPQWHLVFEISDSNLNQLILNLSEENKSNILDSPIGKLIDIFLFENNSSTSQMVQKTAKIIRKIKITTGDIVNYIYQLSIPLYFWETLETDQSFFNNDDNIVYGRFENRTNNVEYHDDNPMWYAKLRGNESLKSIKDAAYKPYINNGLMNSLGVSGDNSNTLTSFFPYVKLGETYNATSSLRTDLLINNSSVFPYRIADGATSFVNVDANNGIIGNPVPTNLINENLILSDKNYYISLCSFNNVGSVRIKENSIVKSKNISRDLLDNFYKLNYSPRSFSHRKYFENDLSEINLKRQNSLGNELSGTIRFLNEKVYRSKIYKNSINGFIETNEFLIYKIHEMTANIKESVNTNPPPNKYIIVEPIAFDTNNKLLNKDYIDVNAPLFNIQNTDTIRIYEDKLKEFSYADHHGTGIDETPYFEINLNSKASLLKITKDSDDVIVKDIYDGDPNSETGVNQIPYYYHDIKNGMLFKTYTYNTDGSKTPNYDDSIKYIEHLYDNNLVSESNKNIDEHLRRYGTPIFKIEEQPKNYVNLQSQEDRIKNFFYGFSRGKNRYPIESLDGFKYGVQNGSKASNKFHFSNKRFGHFSDKIQGSTNTTTVYNDSVDSTVIFERPVSKKFVNEYYENIVADSHVMSYNKDIYARSTYPYIENKENELSQLNPNNSFYDADVASRF